MLYIPVICIMLLQCGEPEGVMKNTPRKNKLVLRSKDTQRFYFYLFFRSIYVALSIGIIGVMCTASTFQSNTTLYER